MFESPFSGVLFFIFLAALPIAFLLNLCIQPLYRRAIGRAMGRSSPLDRPWSVPAERPHDPRALSIGITDMLQRPGLRWSLALRYLLAGLVYASVQMMVLFTLSGIDFGLRRSLIVVAVLAWPLIPFALSVAGLRRGWVLAGTVLWAAALSVIEPQVPLLLAIEVGPVLLVAMVLANRVFRTTSLALYLIAIALILPLLFSLDLALLLVNTFVSAALPVAALILLGVGLGLSWGMVRIVARICRGASDLMLQSHAIWFIMTLWQASLLSSEAGLAALWSGLSLVAYGATLALMGRLGRGPKAEPLLFLRVFGQRHLQQALSMGLMTDWRLKGPVLMIGAGDLATETLDTDELAAFLSGRTRDLFIRSPQDLDNALTRSHRTAADGLHPVLDYYCEDQAWRPTVQTLMHRARRVVLDLRGFSRDNRGVQFEIGQLVRRTAIEDLTVLIDAQTDVPLARDLFEAEWRAVQGGSATPVKLDFLQLGDAGKS